MANKKIEEKIKARILPHSIEAEQAVLGCALIDQEEAQLEILSKLKTKDFYSSAHKTVFKAMKVLFNKSTQIDFITLTAQLESTQELNDVGGLNYMTTLSNVVPSAANYNNYLIIVKKNSVLRKLIKASEKIIENSYESINKNEALDFAEAQIFALNEETNTQTLVSIKDITERAIEEMQEAQLNKGKFTGVATGFYQLDKNTNGLQKGDLVLIAARPAVGKTTFAMNIANNTAIKHAKKVAIFEMEMSDTSLVQRSLASVAMVDLSKIKRGELNEKEWLEVLEARKLLNEKANMFIESSGNFTPATILSKCRKQKRKNGLDLVVIDYLQLMSSGLKNSENRNVEVSSITRALKLAAMELQVPIILLSQLSRQSEKNNREPILSDLRESGAIEQDADIVMFLHPESREAQYNTSLNVKLIVAKHRNGPTFMTNLKFYKQHTLFVDQQKNQNYKSLEQSAPPQIEHNKPIEVEATVIKTNDKDIDDIFQNKRSKEL